MSIIYRGSNTVYAEIKNEDGTRSLMIVSLDRLCEIVNTLGMSAYIDDLYGVCPFEIEKVRVDSHETFQHYNMVSNNRYSVMASTDPCHRLSDGSARYRPSMAKFDGLSIGGYLCNNVNYDSMIGRIIGSIVMYGSIEDEYVYCPDDNRCIIPMLGIRDYDLIMSDSSYLGTVIYDSKFYRMCTELLQMDTNTFTKTLPENILDFTPDFARGIFNRLVVEATNEERNRYPHRIAGQLGMIHDAIYGRPSDSREPVSSAPIAGWESPRDDYGYRIFTASGVFVTNAVLCKSEG